MSDLSQLITESNRKAGVARQRTFAKKTYLKQSDVELIRVLCDRADDLFAAHAKGQDLRTALNDLKLAVSVARRQKELPR